MAILRGTAIQTNKKSTEFTADTTTVWSRGQLLIESDTLKMKIGDGINIYKNLRYSNLSPDEVRGLVQDNSHTHANKTILDQINQDMVERMQQDAVTPVANVETTVDGARITITDYKGTTKAEIKSGKEINTSYDEESETIIIGGDGGFSDLTQSERDQIQQNKTDIGNKLDVIKDESGNKYNLLIKGGKLYYDPVS